MKRRPPDRPAGAAGAHGLKGALRREAWFRRGEEVADVGGGFRQEPVMVPAAGEALAGTPGDVIVEAAAERGADDGLAGWVNHGSVPLGWGPGLLGPAG